MLHFAWTAALSFSPAPLRVSFAFSALVSALGMLIGLYAVARKLLGLPVSPGWTSLLIVVCLIGAGTLLSIGVLGEYIARIFEEVKGRPLYVVSISANIKPLDTKAVGIMTADAELTDELVSV
jgi:dolichol-phosphate mannosyltransferase